MAPKANRYADMQAFVQKEIQTQFETLYKQYATKYGVASVPLHRHNGADSPTLSPSSIDSYLPLPGTSGGVASPDVLTDGQVVNDTNQANNSQLAATVTSQTIYVDPFPILYDTESDGFQGGEAPIGTSLIVASPSEEGVTLWLRVNTVPSFTKTTVTATGSISSGSTSATLHASWPFETGIYWITFSNGESRPGGFINANTAVNWNGATTSGANATLNVSAVGWYGIAMNLLLPV